MLFKKYEIVENKLSEQLSDDNPYKQKLIDMETPKDKSPIYSTICIGLLIYVLIFAGNIIYNQAYGWEIVLISTITTVIGFIFLYKKTYIQKQNIKNRTIIILCFMAYFIVSSIIGFLSKEGIKYSELYNIFLLTNINNKSYIALCVLSSITLGIVLSYYSCPYETKFRFIKNRGKNSDESESIINFHFYVSIFALIYLFPIIFFSFDSNDHYFSYRIFLLSVLPVYINSSFQQYFYLKTFKKAISIKE